MIDLLAEKELLQVEELDDRNKAIAGRLIEKFIDEGMGNHPSGASAVHR